MQKSVGRYTINVHFRKVYNLFVRALETDRKARQWLVYLPCFTRVQIIFTLNDNIHILCLSCNIKKSKTSTTLFENSWSKRRSDRFQWCHLWRQSVYCYHVTISFCRSTWITYQKYFIRFMTKLHWSFFDHLLLVLKITQLQDNVQRESRVISKKYHDILRRRNIVDNRNQRWQWRSSSPNTKCPFCTA